MFYVFIAIKLIKIFKFKKNQIKQITNKTKQKK